MYLELPKFTRCCLCLPLRRGILSVAYFYMACSLLSIGFMTHLLIQDSEDSDAAAKSYSGSHFFRNNIFIFIVLLLDIIFDVVLIVGGHTKNVLLMKVYYYYGITTTLSAFIMNMVILCIPETTDTKSILIQEICYIFTSVALQSYLILLVRSEVLKLTSSQSAHYVNDLTDVAVSDQFKPYAHNQLHSEQN